MLRREPCEPKRTSHVQRGPRRPAAFCGCRVVRFDGWSNRVAASGRIRTVVLRPRKSLCNLCVLLYEVRSTSTSYTHMIPSRDVMRSYLHLCFPFVVAPVQTKTFSFSASSRRNDTEHPVPQNPPLMGEGVFSTLCVYSLICSCAFFSCRVSLPPSVLPQLNPSQVHEKVLSRVFLLNIRAPPHTDQNAYFDSLGHACKRL